MSSSSTDQSGTRGLPSPFSILGEGLQSVALGIVERGDINTAFSTRAVGTVMITLLLIVGTLIASFASELSESILFSALTVPVVRADLMVLLLSRLVHIFIWAGKLRPNKILYVNEVFPLQAAAIIWNDCKPIKPHTRGEDENSVLIDILRGQKQLWRPTLLDSTLARVAKTPIYALIQLGTLLFLSVERVLFIVWHLLFDRGERNYTPVPVQGEKRVLIGHTALISDSQLTWIQEYTMRNMVDTLESNREARRVLIRAVHAANLLAHGGYTRLLEHGSGNHAMSEYYSAASGNKMVRDALGTSTFSRLGVLAQCPNGNKLVRGEVVPRQLAWARLVVGSLKGLHGEGRWRGAVAMALFTVARENQELWGESVDRTALHRHVYTVSRRWLVDWIMFIWYEIDITSAIVNEPERLFEKLSDILRENLMHNTQSLPHAVGELAISEPREREVESMVGQMLGADWEIWFENAVLKSGQRLREGLVAAGKWKCTGRAVGTEVTVDSGLYETRRLGEVIDVGENATTEELVRAKIAEQILKRLVERVYDVWIALPHRLLDPPDILYTEDEL